MNIKKIVAGVLVLLAWGVSAQAISAQFRVGGQLTSYSAIIPGYPDIVSSFDPEIPTLEGRFTFYFDQPQIGLQGSFREFYHNINFSDTSNPTRNAVASFPSNSYRFYRISTATNTYDPVTRTLHSQVRADFEGETPFCVGSVAICAGIYGNRNIALLDIVLTFDPTLTNFTGTGFYTTTLANGTVISKEYALANLPIPSALWLFSSGLVGMVGAVRRKRRLAAIQ